MFWDEQLSCLALIVSEKWVLGSSTVCVELSLHLTLCLAYSLVHLILFRYSESNKVLCEM